VSVALCVRFKAVSTQAEDVGGGAQEHEEKPERQRRTSTSVANVASQTKRLHMRRRVMADSRQNRRVVDAGSALGRGGAFSCIRIALLFSGL